MNARYRPFGDTRELSLPWTMVSEPNGKFQSCSSLLESVAMKRMRHSCPGSPL